MFNSLQIRQCDAVNGYKPRLAGVIYFSKESFTIFRILWIPPPLPEYFNTSIFRTLDLEEISMTPFSFSDYLIP
jgi:hypothetical protein